MFDIFEYMREQMEKQMKKKARREAVGKFLTGFFLSLLGSILVCGVFALVAYSWFKYIMNPAVTGLLAPISVSVFVFILTITVGLIAWYSGDDEDVD